METRIGQGFCENRKIAWIAVCVSVLAICGDIYLVTTQGGFANDRIVLAFAAVFVLALLVRGRETMSSFGFTWRLAPSYRYWGKATLLIGAAVGAFCLIIGVVLVFTWNDLPSYLPSTSPKHVGNHLWHACVLAPIIEEPPYRLLLCVPLVAAAGPRVAIFISGAVFGALHFIYGNPGPDNFIAGYFLAWAYLKSGSFLMPVMLHALGNAIAVGSQVLYWYATTA